MSIFLGFDTAKAWDYENAFHLTSDVTRLGKIAAHFELYRMITGLPGHVVELGVFKGCSLVRFATFRELLESPRSRKIIGFDAFGAFPAPDAADPHAAADKAFVAGWEHGAGQGITVEALRGVLAHKGIGNVELVAGDIRQTLPVWAAAHPAARVALLHIDTDVREPAALGLELLYDRVVPGGIVVLDDYGTECGGTAAVEAFFAGRGVRLCKLPFSHETPVFVVKE